MKRIQLISLVNSLFLFSNVCAVTLKAPTFSPYVDYIPTMSEGLIAEGKEVIRAASDGLTFNVDIMAMDYGSAYAGDMGSYAIEATISLHQFLQEAYPEKLPHSLWKFIEVTPVVGVNDVQKDQFT